MMNPLPCTIFKMFPDGIAFNDKHADSVIFGGA